MTSPINIHLTDAAALARPFEPISLGIPLPQGQLTGDESLSLSYQGQTLPLDLRTTARWPDGSARWVLATFQTPVDYQAARGQARLEATEQKPERASPFTVTESDTEWRICTTTEEHRLNKATGTLTTRAIAEQAQAETSTKLTFALQTRELQPAQASIEHCNLSHSGQVSVQLTLAGHWQLPEKPRFECTLTFYAQGGLVEVAYCLHNPRRARHPGGLWDLGDAGSFYFTGLHAELTLTSGQGNEAFYSNLQAEPGSEPVPGPARLYQDSSGGENWNSLNHVDKEGKVTTRFKGYRLSRADENHGEGLRAQPMAEIGQAAPILSLAMPKFWQNFPSALAVTEQGANLGLFPTDSGQCYELQGGERKTQRFYIAFGQPMQTLAWVAQPLVPVLPAQHYEAAQAFTWFKADPEPGPLDDLINIGLEGENNFFAKREAIDEYGWRNFGDIFADHETLYQPEGEPPLVSHYNNQYDAICGFARQFALTGDQRWFELMDDLAHHVTDIDIYHTDEDRAEYNHGLFWHTDHYLPAHTVTHRTFTRHNDTSSTPGQTGGGPAAEHCYTTGLMLHYFMTGCEASKQAVVDLADWMITLHDGQPGLLTRLWSIKKDDLARLKKHLKGEASSPYQYPFTRGTGNYLTSLIDAYEVTANQAYLSKAEAVIRATLHPEDDIQKRNLLNVELCWSYLVMLASITRYLELKNRIGQLDEAFGYARASLLHYTQWMRQHEQPFLADPAQLEFPNDTWVAQDVRKAMLMFQAADLNPSEAEAYRRKGEQWFREVVEHLSKSPTRHFARILIILMQNHGPNTVRQAFDAQAFQHTKSDFGEAPRLTTPRLVASLATKSLKGVLEFRPSREKAWLNTRLNRP